MAPVQFGRAKLLTHTGSWLDGGADALRLAPGCVRRGLLTSTAPRVWEWESRNAKTLDMSVMEGMALPTVIGVESKRRRTIVRLRRYL